MCDILNNLLQSIISWLVSYACCGGGDWWAMIQYGPCSAKPFILCWKEVSCFAFAAYVPSFVYKAIMRALFQFACDRSQTWQDRSQTKYNNWHQTTHVYDELWTMCASIPLPNLCSVGRTGHASPWPTPALLAHFNWWEQKSLCLSFSPNMSRPILSSF